MILCAEMEIDGQSMSDNEHIQCHHEGCYLEYLSFHEAKIRKKEILQRFLRKCLIKMSSLTIIGR